MPIKKSQNIPNDTNTSPNIFVGDLGEYRFVETSDSTKTLWSGFFDETFHNTTGALEETHYTYLEATQISRMFDMPIFSILEVGFGMGIGFFAIDDFLKMYLAKKESLKNREISLHFLSFEIDYGMLKHVIDLNINKTNILPNLNTWKINKNEDGVIDRLEITKDIIIDITKNIVLHFSGVILIGDGRAVLRPHCQKFSTPPFHAIFQDAFSPRKNPDLWTVEWFDLLKVLSGKEVILSTYSSSTSIRKSLLKAQWNLYNQKGYGHKKAMTKATLNEDILGEKDQELLSKLALSQSSPIYDRDTFDFLDKRSQHKLNNK